MPNFAQQIALAFCLMVVTLPAWSQTADKPNILMIVVDDLNDYQHYLLDGHPQVETPNLNRLARSGVVFQSAYCTAPKSGPSRASFMSGKDPDYTGIYDNEEIQTVFRENFQILSKDTVVYTMAEVLRDSGYYTVGINKVYYGWKNEGFDNDFDSQQTDPCLRKLSWSNYIAFVPDRDIKDLYEDEGVPGYIWSPFNDTLEPYTIDYLAADTAVGLLEAYAAHPDQFCNRPLFMALGIFLPHKPLTLPQKYFRPDYVDTTEFYSLPFPYPYNIPANQWPPNGVIMPPQPEPKWADYETLPPFGQSLATDGDQEGAFEQWMDLLPVLPSVDPMLDTAARKEILAEAKRANAVISYLAAVKSIDHQIGRVLDALDSSGLAETTVVILVSDHGYSLGEKKHWHKFALWETVNRIPLVIRHPEKSFAEQVFSPVSTLDLFPTVLDIAGIGSPRFPDGRPYLDGISLMPFVEQPALMVNRPALTSLRKPNGQTSCFVQFSVRDEQFHYIKYRGVGGGTAPCDTANAPVQEELYWIGTYRDQDKYEWTNLAGDPRFASVKDYLSQWIADSALFASTAPRIELVHDVLPCVYELNDTLSVCYLLTDAHGVGLGALPPGTTVRYYTSRKPDEKFYTNVFTQRVRDLVNLANYGVNTPFLIFVELVQMETGVVLAQDFLPVTVNPDNLPTLSFSLNHNINYVMVENITLTTPEKIRGYRWDFGDGWTSSDPKPAGHAYALPGTYTVTGSVLYGNDTANLCANSFSASLTLPDSLFEDGPCQAPNHVRKLAGLTDEIQVEWNPVYGSEGYTVRYRQTSGSDTAWQYGYTETTNYTISPVEPVQEFELQVQSRCDTARTQTAQSPWSYPIRVSSGQCFSPRGIQAEDIQHNSARLHWLPNPAADLGYQVYFRKPGEWLNTRHAPEASLLLSGLDTAAQYLVDVVSLCSTQRPDLAPAPGVSGWYSFHTDSSTLKSQTLVESSLTLRPNPTRNELTIRWTASADERVTLEIHHAAGHLVARRRIAQSAGANQVVYSARDLSPGQYWLTLRSASAVQSQPFQVIP